MAFYNRRLISVGIDLKIVRSCKCLCGAGYYLKAEGLCERFSYDGLASRTGVGF